MAILGEELADLEGALQAFERAGDREALLACSRKALEEGWLETAVQAFRVAAMR